MNDMPNVKARLLTALREQRLCVVANGRRLTANWAVEWEQELQAAYNVEAEKELVRVLTAFVERNFSRGYAKKKLNRSYYSKGTLG